MSVYSLPALLALALNASLIFILLLDDPKGRTHRLLALLVMCVVAWNVADIVVINSRAMETARAATVLIAASIVFAPAVFLLLSISFPLTSGRRLNRWPVTGAVLFLPLLWTAVSALQVLKPLKVYWSPALQINDYILDVSAEPLSAAMYALLLVSLGLAVAQLRFRIRHAGSRAVRRQALYLILGIAAFALLLIALGVPGDQQVHYFVARILVLLLSCMFACAVLGSRSIVLRRISNQGVAYSIVTGAIFAFYLLVINHVADIIGRQFAVSSVVLDGLFILLLAFSFRPLVARVQSLVEQVFYQKRQRYRQQFVPFSHELLGLTTVRDLAAAAVRFLTDALSASAVDVLLADGSSGKFWSALGEGQERELDHGFLERIEAAQSAVEIADVVRPSPDMMQPCLKAFEGGVAVPLRADKGLTGILLVGPSSPERPYTPDETDFLATFANGVSIVLERNVLVERMRAEEMRSAKMEKLASLGRLTAGIAHEFRNPLNIISTAAQTILRNPDDAGVHRETALYIVEEAEQLNRTVDDFLQFARPHMPVWEQCNLADVIENALAPLRARAAEARVHLVTTVPEGLLSVTTSPGHLERILSNLCLNAIEAMPHGGTLTLGLQRRADSTLTLSVGDTGPGIPPEHHARLFDPFFTTKPAGTGLGLAIVFMLVRSLKGAITFTTGGSGTTFQIALPLDGSLCP